MYRMCLMFVTYMLFCCSAFTHGAKYLPTDILFVVDGSGSVGVHNFHRMKVWLASISTDIKREMGDRAQLGVVAYSATHHAPMRLGDCVHPECMEEKIMDIPYQGSSTYTHEALKFALEEEMPHSSRASFSNKVIVLVTDGMAFSRKQLPDWYEKASRQNILTAAVGVGGSIKMQELRIVANGGSSDDRVFLTQNFGTLPAVTSPITDMIYSAFGSPEACDPLDIMFVVDGSGSIRNSSFESVRRWLISTCADIINDFGKQAQIGVYQYSHYYEDRDHAEQIVEIPFRLGDCFTLDCMTKKLQGMRHLNHTTYTHYALKRTLELEFPHSRRAEMSRKVIILVTDGRAFDSELLPLWYIDSVEQGITSYAVGVGNFTHHELRVVANGGYSDERVFTADDFGGLPQHISKEIVHRFGACPEDF